MPITDRQREERRKTIGSSDSPAILGLSPFSTAHDVWESKFYGVDKWDGDAPLPTHVEAGNYLEPAALKWLADKAGLKLRRNVSRRLRGEVFAANLDAIGEPPKGGPRVVVEAKVASVRFWEQLADREGRDDLAWGEDGSDEVPSPVLVQTQHQMMVTGLLEARVVAALVDRTVEFKQFIIPRNDAMIAIIISAGHRFWDCVCDGTPPDPTAPLSLRVLSAMHRHDVPVQLGEDAAAVVETWLSTKRKASALHELERGQRALALAQLGDSEEGILPDGRRLTFRQQERRGLDEKLLRLAHPDIAAQYTRRTTFRRALVTQTAPRPAITADPVPMQLEEGCPA
jgi:putative phage-type endonuclease